MSGRPDRIVLLTPTLAGADGLSCLARQVAGALAGLAPVDGVEVWTLSESETPADLLPPLVRVRATGGSRLRYVMRALAASRGEWSHTLVVVLHVHLLPVAWPLLVRGAQLLPVLVGIEAWRPLSALRRRMLGSAPLGVAISAHTAREFARANPALATLPIAVCHPATPPAVSATALPVSAQPPFALVVGRLAGDERYKGHDALIDVWPQVRAEIPAARLVVAGGGDDLARLQQRVAEAGLAGAIEFTGHLPGGALRALYAQAAFFVLPSRHEGFGLVYLEAMQCGRACIGGRGAAAEIIQHGRTGLIVDLDHPPALATAIVTLFRDPDLCARLGEAGRRRAREQFTAFRFARDLDRAIGMALAAAAPT
jgi:phosphatidylinositol alpha-1,6-mannosyltransferase